MGKRVRMVVVRIPQIQERLHRLCVDVSYATSVVHCCELASSACACVCGAVEYALHIRRSRVNSLYSFMCWPHFMTCRMRRVVTEFTLIRFVVYVKTYLFIVYCTPHDERFKPDTISICSALRKCSIFKEISLIFPFLLILWNPIEIFR